jgi:hypothetical protein
MNLLVMVVSVFGKCSFGGFGSAKKRAVIAVEVWLGLRHKY